ncbi:Branched-chain amino acid aminotransferase 2, chloroplastic [Sesamum angolense]|uniref:Branched-chain amino acid aminotransferase 2, chloroplastic n=1 Tax=Sesamum angolense TaxID=2727404 RepID=A0AAE1WHW7_9LAMI|nr:Branched-chain amino acid aminotransferase 2, chloroplastic [Sesamum angolense]
MESGAVFAGLHPNPPSHHLLLGPSRSAIKLLPPLITDKKLFSSHPPQLQLQKQLHFASFSNHNSNNVNSLRVASPASNVALELADIDWDNLGFGLMPTDYMYIMGVPKEKPFLKGLFEGLKAYRKHDGSILLFRPEENGLRLRMGAERMCMPAPTVEQFVEAVKETVLANERWIPPPGKGSLYIRPLLMGSGAVLGLAPAPEYTFLIYVSPVGNYFKEGLAPINLIVETEMHRATPGGTGGVKTIGNYAAGNEISTPAIKGTILPGITRKSILDVARSQGFEVAERQVTVEELLEADEVFCTGTAVVVSPVGSITYLNKRVTYGSDGVGRVSQQLYSALTSLQMGLTEDKMGWIVELK